MHHRSLLLVSLGFLVAASHAAAEPSTRLFEVFCQRFIRDTQGEPIIDLGRLTADGEFKHYTYVQAGNIVVPPEALDKNLLPFAIFPAYLVLGNDALANFKITGNVKVAGQDYFVIAKADDPKLDIGSVVNLATRGTVAPGGDPLIGGFVVEGHSRRVLVRAVGPTLGTLAVRAPLANPVLTLFRQGEPAALAANDDWGAQPNASEIETAATTVGAFPLSRTSRDSALLLELPPGAYTAQVASPDATGGTALLEIYLLP